MVSRQVSLKVVSLKVVSLKVASLIEVIGGLKTSTMQGFQLGVENLEPRRKGEIRLESVANSWSTVQDESMLAV